MGKEIVWIGIAGLVGILGLVSLFYTANTGLFIATYGRNSGSLQYEVHEVCDYAPCPGSQFVGVQGSTYAYVNEPVMAVCECLDGSIIRVPFVRSFRTYDIFRKEVD